ncbi:ArnT family glycosyltransferase [Nanoarchaeota archaeon]
MEGQGASESNKSLEKRKEFIKQKINSFLKDKYNLLFLGVFIFAILIRFYYFFITTTQPLWWDELVYGSLAKNFISNAWSGTPLISHELIIRPFFFSFIWSLLLRIGISEIGVRFLLELIPSILSVFFVYLIGKETFGKRAGIFSAFVFSVLWIHLFYTARLLTNVPALLFLFSSVYFFIKSTKSNFNFRLFSISLFLLSISTLIRYPNGIIFLAYLFILIIGKSFLIKKIKFWYSGIIGISPLLLFFLYNKITFGNIFPAILGADYISVGSGATTAKAPLAFHILSFIPVYLKTIFLAFFILGLIILLFELLAGYNLITKNKKLKNYLLILSILVAIYSFFIFYMRGADDRWLFATSLPLSCLVGFGTDTAYKFIKKYSSYLAILVIFGLFLMAAHSQISHADNLIKEKKQSYLQMRQAFEWIKSNSPEGSVIVGGGIEPYSIYYADRTYLQIPSNESESYKISEANYLVVHSFVPQVGYINKYLQENQDKWQIVNAFFFDQEQKQPAVIIYRKILG